MTSMVFDGDIARNCIQSDTHTQHADADALPRSPRKGRIMSKRNKPRLGKGLSALIGEPVKIDSQAPTDTEQNTHIEMKRAANAATPAHADGDGRPDGRRLLMIPLDAIEPSPYQPRTSIEDSDLTSLAESIRRTGVMQPIVVRPAHRESGGAASWELIAGERRWRAATLAGLATIPAVQADIDDRTAAEWALIENIQREELNPMERALALRTLRDRFGLTQAEIAKHVGLERSSVANFLRLTDLPEEVRTLIASGALSAGHGKALAGLETNGANAPEIISLARRASDDNWSVRRMEQEASRKNHNSHRNTGNRNDAPAHHDELERQLSEHLGTKVKIRANAAGKKGRIELSFFDLEHFDGLMDRLGFRMRS